LLPPLYGGLASDLLLVKEEEEEEDPKHIGETIFWYFYWE
jgi:hypothetical protein